MGRKQRTDIDAQAIITAYQGGTSASVLAKQHKCSVWSIIARLRNAGIDVRSFKEQNERRLGLDADQMSRFESLVDGILLGDGQIDRKGLLRLEQENSRRGWLDQVQAEINDLGGSCRIIPIPPKTRIIEGRTIRSKAASLLYTPAYVELKPHRARWYPKEKKIVPRDLKLTPLTVTHWFAGDGTYDPKGHLRFCTNGFLQEDTEYLAREFGVQLGIRATTQESYRPGQFYIDILRRDEAVKIRSLMTPYLADCIQYKVQHVRPTLRSQGRQPRKLTDAQVRELRHFGDAGESYASLGRRFGITDVAARQIVRRLVYKDLV